LHLKHLRLSVRQLLRQLRRQLRHL
jgi:hypothetical protein